MEGIFVSAHAARAPTNHNQSKIMKPKMFRQGDVLIERIAKIPESVRKQSKQKRGQRITVALGEATGHHHSLDIRDADWWKTADETDIQRTQYLNVKKAANLTHQEHAPIPLAPGKYKVTIQREYSPAEIRRVAD